MISPRIFIRGWRNIRKRILRIMIRSFLSQLSISFYFRYREADNLTQASGSSSLNIDNDDINWIVHVSDLHFSKFRDSRRPIDFEVGFLLFTYSLDEFIMRLN